MRGFSLPLFCWLFCLIIPTSLVACLRSNPAQATILVTPINPEDDITWEIDHETALFKIYSQSGIGSADIEFTSGGKPEKVVMQFYLAGLEELRFEYDDAIVIASVSSFGDNAVNESVSFDGSNPPKTQSITQESPYWMDVTLVPKQGEGKIPLPDGYLEVKVPRIFSENNYLKFSVSWTDFFR